MRTSDFKPSTFSGNEGCNCMGCQQARIASIKPEPNHPPVGDLAVFKDCYCETCQAARKKFVGIDLATAEAATFKRDDFYRPFGQSAEYSATKTIMDHHLEWLQDFRIKVADAITKHDPGWAVRNRDVFANETDGDVAARTIGWAFESMEQYRKDARDHEREAHNQLEMRHHYQNEYNNLRRQIDKQLWNRIKRGFKRAFEYPGKLYQGPPGPAGHTGPRGEPAPGHSCQCLECNPQRDNGPF